MPCFSSTTKLLENIPASRKHVQSSSHAQFKEQFISEELCRVHRLSLVVWHLLRRVWVWSETNMFSFKQKNNKDVDQKETHLRSAQITQNKSVTQTYIFLRYWHFSCLVIFHFQREGVKVKELWSCQPPSIKFWENKLKNHMQNIMTHRLNIVFSNFPVLVILAKSTTTFSWLGFGCPWKHFWKQVMCLNHFTGANLYPLFAKIVLGHLTNRNFVVIWAEEATRVKSNFTK